MLYGIILGITYIIPGLCSASMAISLGVYNDLLELFSSFYKFKIIKKNILFIMGMVIGILISITILSSLYDKVPFIFMSLFIGFICSGYPKKQKKTKNKISDLLSIIVFASSILILNSIGNIRIIFLNNNYSIFSIIFIFFIGILASLALILPGVSGAMILYIFGIYEIFLKTFKGIIAYLLTSQPLLEGNFIVLMVFGGGFLLGILAFSKIIDKISRDNKSLFLNISRGFLIGSIIVLVIKLAKITFFTPYFVLSLCLITISFIIGKITINKF